MEALRPEGRAFHTLKPLLLMFVAFFFAFDFLDFTEEVGSKNKVVEQFVVRVHHFVLRAFPFLTTLVDVKDVFANAHYGVHVVGIDDGRRVKLPSDVVNEVVDDE